jgi:hypothetical protein
MLTPDEVDKIVSDILNSVKLAIEPYTSEEAVDVIMATVDDYIDNHYDEEWNFS